MADISKIKVGTDTYDIKDAIARTNAQDAINATANLGALAYKDSATGTVTARGTISKPNISLTSTAEQIKSCESIGSLPQWTASVNSETLEFNFQAGTLPTVSTVTVNNVTAASLEAAPTFTGSATSVTVS